jgi:hypothetical protein
MNEIDINRAAKQLLEQYGEGAQMEAAMRASTAINDRNKGGEQMWEAVGSALRAIEDSGNTTKVA